MSEKIFNSLTKAMNTDIENYAVMSNDFIFGRFNLSINAEKILYLCIAQIKSKDRTLEPYFLSVNDYAKLLGAGHPSYLYKQFQKYADELTNAKIMFMNSEGKKCGYIPLTQAVLYSNKGIYIKLNDLLASYLLSLKKRYTQLKIKNIINLSSSNTITIFKIICEANHTKVKNYSVKVSVSDLRFLTKTENKYKDINDFKKRIITPAVNDINKNTLLDVTACPYPSRLPDCFIFEVTDNTIASKVSNNYSVDEDYIKNIVTHAAKRNIKAFETLNDETKTTVSRWHTNYGYNEDIIIKAFERALSLKCPGDIGVMYIDAIICNWYSSGIRNINDFYYAEGFDTIDTEVISDAVIEIKQLEQMFLSKAEN